MERARLTLKNYRCFSDAAPLQFEIGPGFTAIVGPNNSGKSALKLFLYELRPLFQMIGAGVANVAQCFQQGFRHTVNYPDVSDVEEIFNNSNERDINVEIEVIDPSTERPNHQTLNRMVISCARQAPTSWTFAFYGSRSPAGNIAGQNANLPHGNGVPVLAIQQQGLIDYKDFFEIIQILSNARYYGAFRNTINQGAATYFDLRVGTSFIELWNEWKTGGNRAQNRAIDQVTEDIRRLFGFQRLEINTSTKLNTLMVSIDGQPYRINELGSGLTQFIMVFGNAATTSPSLILIDEPESNLHPALQIDFVLSLASYAREGVMFSTHSIGLARSVADRIYSIQRHSGQTIVRPFEATPNYAEFVGELSFSTFKDMGYDNVLLVEGVSEVKAVQQLLRLVKKEHTTVIVPLSGDEMAIGGRELELTELTRLSANVYALVDSERADRDAPPAGRRQQFAETCDKLGIKICLTERRATENYFSDRAVKAALGSAHAALEPFQLLKDAPKPWPKSDNWKIARQMGLSEITGTDLGQFLQAL